MSHQEKQPQRPESEFKKGNLVYWIYERNDKGYVRNMYVVRKRIWRSPEWIYNLNNINGTQFIADDGQFEFDEVELRHWRQ